MPSKLCIDMKKIICILCFLFFYNTYSQVEYGLIEYKKVRLKKIFKDDKKDKSANFEKFQKLESSINKVQKEIVFDLIYKNGESFFEVRKKMSVSENKFFKISLGSDGNSKYYNSVNKILRQVNTFGEDFLISKPNYIWTLKKETKKIGKYNCFKATMVEKMKTRKGIKNVLIEAWYTPDINIPFGPIGYSGLPGLIMELKRNKIKYYVNKINLNPKENTLIKEPTKGKKVTQEEFYDIAIKAMKGFRKNRGY